MIAKGTFEVDLTPISEDSHPAGRMTIDKVYSGDFVGKGVGQMLSKRTETGVSAYCAVEEVEGVLDGKSGGFTLIHNGVMSAESSSLEIIVLAGSGTGELTGISGKKEIVQSKEGHQYILTFSLP